MTSWVSTLPDDIRQLLQLAGVVFEPLDDGTARFLATPLSPQFSKARTNLLFRHQPQKPGAAVYVDDDLSYAGGDPAIESALAGPSQKKWRRMRMPLQSGRIEEVLEGTLEFLRSPLLQPVRASLAEVAAASTGNASRSPLLRSVGTNEAASAFQSSTRKELARQLAVLTTRRAAPSCGLLWGLPGCGRDHLLLASALPAIQQGRSVYRVSGAGFASRCLDPDELDAQLMKLLNSRELYRDCLLLVSDFDLCLSRSVVAGGLWCDAIDRGVRFLGSVRDPQFMGWLRLEETLSRRIVPVEVASATNEQTLHALEHLAADSPLDIAPQALQSALYLSNKNGAVQPAGAIGQLSAAIAEAEARNSAHLGPDDVYAVKPYHWSEIFSHKKE